MNRKEKELIMIGERLFKEIRVTRFDFIGLDRLLYETIDGHFKVHVKRSQFCESQNQGPIFKISA